MGEPGNVELPLWGGLRVGGLLTRRSGKYCDGALSMFPEELWPSAAGQAMYTSPGDRRMLRSPPSKHCGRASKAHGVGH